MTLVRYLLNAGPQDGTVSNANSGSTAYSTLNGSTTTYDAAVAAHGPFGMKVTSNPTSQMYRRFEFSDGASAINYAASFVLTLPSSSPGSTVQILRIATGSGTQQLGVLLSAAGNIELLDLGQAHHVVAVTGLTWGQKYRISIVTTGGSTTAGQIQFKVYSGTTAWTTQHGSTYTASNFNFGTDPASRFEIGVATTTTPAVTLGIDDIQLDDVRTTEIPDYATPSGSELVDEYDLVWTGSIWK